MYWWHKREDEITGNEKRSCSTGKIIGENGLESGWHQKMGLNRKLGAFKSYGFEIPLPIISNTTFYCFILH